MNEMQEHILIVDENQQAAQQLADILSPHYVVTAASTHAMVDAAAQDDARVLTIFNVHSLLSIGLRFFIGQDIQRTGATFALYSHDDDIKNVQSIPQVLQYPFESASVLKKISKILKQRRREMALEDVIARQQTEIESEKIANQQNQLQLEALTANLPGGIAVLESSSGRIHVHYANAGMYHLLGYTGKSDGFSIEELLRHQIPKEEYIHLQRQLEEAVKEQHNVSCVFHINQPKGGYIWCSLTCRPFSDKDGLPAQYAVLLDVTANRETERRLAARNHQYLLMSEISSDKWITYDVEQDTFYYPKLVDGEVQEISISRYFQDGTVRKTIHPDDYPAFQEKYFNAIEKRTNGSLELRTSLFDHVYTWYRLDYMVVCGMRGTTSQIVGRFLNIHKDKEELSRQKAIIDELSNNDHVSGLLNMQAFEQRVHKVMSELDHDLVYGISYSDINNFSYINEVYGYEAGNKVLRSVGAAVRGLQSWSFGCRIYSDYFLMLHVSPSEEQVLQEIKQVQTAFTQLVKKDFPQSDIQIATGVCYLTADDKNLEFPMDNANIARKQVKKQQGAKIGVYTEEMRQHRLHQQMVTGQFDKALRRREFVLYLQPKFSLSAWETIGAEALVRWRQKDGTFRSPGEFIEILEDVGYVVRLDFYIFECVLEAMERWQRQGIPLIPVSVNLSRIHASNPNLVSDIVTLTDRYNIPHKYIELEATESAMISNAGSLLSKLVELKKAGFVIDMDDFGTGYSSLNLLMESPFDIVKVDKSLIDNMRTEKDKNYIRHLVQLICNADKKVIFEGVETEEQVQMLLDAGCEMGQGFVYERPVPLDEFEQKYMQKSKHPFHKPSDN